MSNTRILVTSLGMVLLLAACGTPGLYVPRDGEGALATPQPSGVATIPPLPGGTTQWETVRSGIGLDGSVPLSAALQAWVVAVGPLPDVEAPAGEEGEDASIELAIRWVLRHWDDMSLEQQTVVHAFLDGEGEAAGPPKGSVLAAARPGSGRETAGPDQDSVEQWTVAAQAARDRIRTLLGRPLRSAIKVEFRVTSVKEGTTNLAFTLAQNAKGEYHKGPMTTCHIWIPPVGQGLSGADLVAVISHEVLHCYQYELTPVETVIAMPDWFIEGTGAWAGEDIVANGELFGGSVIPASHFWRNWLLWPQLGLFKRDYDAIGFFAHLKDEGIDPWKLLDPMQKAMLNDSYSAYEVATKAANGAAAIDAWGPSLFRNVENAPVWDTRGPGLPYEVTTPPLSGTVGETDTLVLGLSPLAAYPLSLDLQAETVTFIAPAARGKIRFSDGSQQNLADILGRPICTKGTCECPAGSEGSAHSFVSGSAGTAMVGLTGHTDGIELTIQGYPLDLTCQLPPEDFQPPQDCMCPSIFGILPGLPPVRPPTAAAPISRSRRPLRGRTRRRRCVERGTANRRSARKRHPEPQHQRRE